MGTPRENAFDKQVVPAADRINGTVPDRRWPNGKPVPVAMEDTTFSKRDGAYQNGLLEQAYSKRDGAYTNGVLKDIAALIHQVGAKVGANLDQTLAIDGKLAALQGVLEAKTAGTVDAEAVAAQIVELLPDDIAQDVVAALGRQLNPTPEGA